MAIELVDRQTEAISFDHLVTLSTIIDAQPCSGGFYHLVTLSTVIQAYQPPGPRGFDRLAVISTTIKPPTNWLLIGGLIAGAGVITALVVSFKK